MPATAYVLDAGAILGIGAPSTEPLPQPEEGWIVLRIPDGLTLQALRDSPVGRQLMWQQHWYDSYAWSQTAPPAGVYSLRLPVPGSQYKTFAEQQAMLPAGEQVAPVVLVAAALLCIKRKDGSDPLDDCWTRCIEETGDGTCVGLLRSGSQLLVGNIWGEGRYDDLLASSVRTS